ncbi:MAG: copper chaperone [Nostoc sp.]|uniref:copper chaperone n=1 Tax=Nostoc sp. TaxID=1180 RepID=UPI002FFCB732
MKQLRVNTITNAIKTVDASATGHSDPTTKTVVVETESPESAIKTAIAQVGYPAS